MSESDRQRARLLLTISAIALLFLLPFAPIWLVAAGLQLHAFVVMGLSFTGTIIALFISRTRYYRWAARWLILILVAGSGTVFVSEYLNGTHQPELMKFLTLGVLLASLTLSARETITFAIGSFLVV